MARHIIFYIFYLILILVNFDDSIQNLLRILKKAENKFYSIT